MKPAPSVDRPWLMAEVTAWLEAHLKPDWRVLETGCGGSTVFFAERVLKVVTFENNLEWANRVQLLLDGFKFGHRAYLRFEPDYPTRGLELRDGLGSLFDLAFIDGRGRVRSVIDALPAIKPGGYLILDDSDRPRYQEAHRAAKAVCEEVATFVSGPDCTTIWRKRTPSESLSEEIAKVCEGRNLQTVAGALSMILATTLFRIIEMHKDQPQIEALMKSVADFAIACVEVEMRQIQ